VTDRNEITVPYDHNTCAVVRPTSVNTGSGYRYLLNLTRYSLQLCCRASIVSSVCLSVCLSRSRIYCG